MKVTIFDYFGCAVVTVIYSVLITAAIFVLYHLFVLTGWAPQSLVEADVLKYLLRAMFIAMPFFYAGLIWDEHRLVAANKAYQQAKVAV